MVGLKDISTPDFSTPWFRSSWLKSLGLKGPGLKLGVEKSGVEMSFNRLIYFWVVKKARETGDEQPLVSDPPSPFANVIYEWSLKTLKIFS